jgi:enamine deaminase RidA (YjgF/YER057c/UK114 family)
MRNQMDNLEEADLDFSQVVSTNVYLDNLADIPAFEEVYAKYFRGMPPAQTTIQQIAPADRRPDQDEHYPDLEQVSLIAVRKGPKHE